MASRRQSWIGSTSLSYQRETIAPLLIPAARAWGSTPPPRRRRRRSAPGRSPDPAPPPRLPSVFAAPTNATTACGRRARLPWAPADPGPSLARHTAPPPPPPGDRRRGGAAPAFASRAAAGKPRAARRTRVPTSAAPQAASSWARAPAACASRHGSGIASHGTHRSHRLGRQCNTRRPCHQSRRCTQRSRVRSRRRVRCRLHIRVRSRVRHMRRAGAYSRLRAGAS